MVDKPERRQIVDPAVADIFNTDRRIKPEIPPDEPKTKTTSKQKKKKAETDNRDRPMTYRIGDDIIARINEVATNNNVEKSSLVKFLLINALDALEAGELELPLEKKPRKLTI